MAILANWIMTLTAQMSFAAEHWLNSSQHMSYKYTKSHPKPNPVLAPDYEYSSS